MAGQQSKSRKTWFSRGIKGLELVKINNFYSSHEVENFS